MQTVTSISRGTGHSAEVRSGIRPIESGTAWQAMFPTPDRQDRIVLEDGEVSDTVTLMTGVVLKYLDDTARLAPILRRKSLESTCRAVWDFVYRHIQYKLDKKGVEQLRRPARTWQERKTGVDCDCMSIFVSSVLTNLQIPHSFRVTRYSQDHWQHVYVAVPDGRGKEYIIDGVVSRFNYEKPYSAKMDYPMNLSGIQVAVLSGLPEDALYEAVMAPGLSDTEYSELSGTTAQELDAIYRHLVATRDAVRQNPAVAGRNEDPQALLKMLDYAITYFKTDKRDEALSVLVRNEERINSLRGLSFDSGEYHELGAVQPKKFFASVKTAVSNAGKAVAKAATTATKTTAKAVVKYNPVSIVARNGYLLALKLNVSGMASKLKWGYATQAQAAAKGVSASDWQRSKSALVKVEKLFSDKLQGSKTALQNAILKGKAGGLSGEGYSTSSGLGEPITASAIAAAAPLIIATINILKEAGLIGNNVKVDANTIALEVASDPNAAAVMSQLEPGESSSSLPIQPEITENEAAVQRDSNTLYTENPTKPMENTNKPG
ncbi:MAG: hypothetical protein ACKOCO_09975, partial [Bacteroidota bacterium]